MVERINPNQTAQIEKPKTQETTPAGQFGRVLDQALSATQQVNENQSLSGPAPVGPVPGLISAQMPEHLLQVNQTTDMLDSLSRMLADQGVTARQLAPLMTELNSQAEKLISMAESLPSGDKAKVLLEQTAILAKVQVTKYEVGEFI